MQSIPFDLFDAFLFDMDGTITNSTGIHDKAWMETLAAHGCIIDPSVLQEYAGVPNQRSVEIFNERFGWSLNPVQFSHEKESRFSEH